MQTQNMNIMTLSYQATKIRPCNTSIVSNVSTVRN